MKRLACNGMSGYSTIYPNPNKKNYPKGSDSSRMVDRNHTNPNPLFRFSEKWVCAVVNLPEKL